MKRPIIITSLILLFILPISMHAQTLTKTFGGDSNDAGKAICTSKDGGIIIAGSTRSFMAEGTDMYVVKFNTEGDTLWSLYIGRDTTDFEGLHTEESVAVLENSSDEIIVCGTYHIVGWPDYHGTLLHRISADGELLQSRLYEVMAAQDMVEMDNGGYMISGYGFSGFALSQAHVMMIDEDFDIQWSTQYSGSQEEASGLRGICRMSENEYVVVGYSYGFSFTTGLLSGIDTLGNILWATELFNGEDRDIIFDCVERFDENTVICAGVSGYFSYARYATVWKINTSGSSEWVYTGPGGSGRCEYYDIALNEDGNIAVCGIYDTTATWVEPVGLFTLFNPDGEVLRNKLCHEATDAHYTGMTQLDDAYYLTGPYGPPGPDQEALFSKNHFYDPDTLCGLENIDLGATDNSEQMYLNYEPEFPIHGTTQKSYFVRTGHSANVSEICAHDEVYGVGLDELAATNEANIYPNPFIESFRIESSQVVIHVQVIDLNGRIIPCELDHNSVTFSNSVSAGIYVLTYALDNGNSYVKKLVKH